MKLTWNRDLNAIVGSSFARNNPLSMNYPIIGTKSYYCKLEMMQCISSWAMCPWGRKERREGGREFLVYWGAYAPKNDQIGIFWPLNKQFWKIDWKIYVYKPILYAKVTEWIMFKPASIYNLQIHG